MRRPIKTKTSPRRSPLKQQRIHIGWYAFGDWLASIPPDLLLLYPQTHHWRTLLSSGLNFIWACWYTRWFGLYCGLGCYHALLPEIAVIELMNTVLYNFFCSLAILFVFLIYDATGDYNIYYKEFLFTSGPYRLLFTSSASSSSHGPSGNSTGFCFFNTLIIGSGINALFLIQQHHQQYRHNHLPYTGFCKQQWQSRFITARGGESFRTSPMISER